MQFSVGVEYAFHSLFYMVDLPEGKTVGIRQIAKLNALSETYLSKAFAKLRKGDCSINTWRQRWVRVG